MIAAGGGHGPTAHPSSKDQAPTWGTSTSRAALGKVADRVRDLLPSPLPFPGAAQMPEEAAGPSRSVKRRIDRRLRWQGWANDPVDALNNFVGKATPDASWSPSSTQQTQLRLERRNLCTS